MSENAITTLDQLQNLPPVKIETKEFQDIVRTFYPRLQLAQGLSKAVAEGLAAAGDFTITDRGNIKGIGQPVVITPIDIRWTAINSNESELCFTHDKDSAEYKEIQEKSKQRDSGCMWGPEFLCWLQSEGIFITLLCGSPTARNDATGIKSYMRSTMKLGSRKIQKGQRTWMGMTSSSWEPDTTLPDRDTIIEAIENFQKEDEMATLDEQQSEVPNRG